MKKNILLISVFCMSASCKKPEAPKTNDLKPYPVVEVAQADIIGYQSYPTEIKGIINNEVRAKIQGYITQVLVDEGQQVSTGQPLFRLETNMLNENSEAAKSGILAAESNISAAKAAVNAAKVEVEKLLPLVQKNIISKIQLQTAQANLAKADAQLKQAIAGKQQSVAKYKEVQANIDYSIIRAPISGTLGKIAFRNGSLVGPNDQVPITTISDNQKVYAYFSLNEKEYLNFIKDTKGATVPEKLRNLPMVELQLANGSIYDGKGRIETISGQIDPNTGTMQFRVEFPNPERLLNNGNSGVIKLPKYFNSVLSIPESATYEQQGIIYTYKIKQDTAKANIIEVLDRVNNQIIIKSGLTQGDQVVALGVASLKPNTKIVPKKINRDSLIKSIKPLF